MQASFFGVGAPEAILVGVVALVVFGPKGLAQAAKSLGSTLRSFAPTIREITSVSQELKSTLEQVGCGCGLGTGWRVQPPPERAVRAGQRAAGWLAAP